MIYNITTATYNNSIGCYFVTEGVPGEAVGQSFGNTRTSPERGPD